MKQPLKGMLLAIMVAIAFPLFSSADTQAPANKDTGAVVIPYWVAMRIAQDLISGDECADTYSLMENKELDYKEHIKAADAKIEDLEGQKSKLQDNIDLLYQQAAINDKEFTRLQRQYKQLQVRDRIKVASGAVITGALLVKLLFFSK